MERYFEALQHDCTTCYKIAESARHMGFDPSPRVEIACTNRLSQRVEALLNIEGIAEIIERHLSGFTREEAALHVAKDIVSLYPDDPSRAADIAIRAGLAVLTEGILVAPTGGIADITIRKASDQAGYLAIKYAGPIRSAGGTAQAMSILIADVARRELGLSQVRYSEQEIERFKEEIPLYKNLRNLQYLPSSKEIEIILRHLPIWVDGDPTEEMEIAGYRDLPRIDTNRVRGGACLVIADGIAHKAAKLQVLVNKLGIKGWEFLDELIRLQRTKKTEKSEDDKAKGDKYLREILMGRPVFSEPNRPGGFRLRYGRSRSAGIAGLSIHPATMVITEFIAVGTQLKIERPGKAAAITPCDSIDGPFVLLKNGDFIQINNVKDAERVKDDVSKIVDLGDILIPYGEFLENNHALLPGAFCEEWWKLECSAKGISASTPDNARDAVTLARKGAPLHPRYTYLWHDITADQILALRKFILERGRMRETSLLLAKDEKIKEILVVLCVPHRLRDELVVDDGYALIASLGLDIENEKIKEVIPIPSEPCTDPMELINRLAGFMIKPRAPTRIGARMGRPEKAKERLLENKKITLLFPMGHKTRNLAEVLSNGGKIRTDVTVRRCRECMKSGIDPVCRSCGGQCDPVGMMNNFEIDLSRMVVSVGERLGKDALKFKDSVMGVHGLISGKKIPEMMEKGFLRAKHGVYPFKDGTARVDMTDVPLTHFKVQEIGITVETAKNLGYQRDIYGNELERDDQILELYPQDVIPSRACLEYFVRVAKFVDELLVKVYKQDPFYNVEKPEDLIGHLVIGLAPHTSCGVLARIIGWTNSRVCYAHPYFHASKRRNCDGDEDSLILLLDGLLNFSQAYLPEGRGGTMDSPIVLTTKINPSEIDKEAHNMDIMSAYPLEFYLMAEKGADPKMVSQVMKTVTSKINTPDQYSGLMFTHDTSDLSIAPTESIYSTLADANKMLDAQIQLTRKIRAVDENQVFTILIQHHFLRDMQGCLHTFHSQRFLCSKCNYTTRRIPLSGRCPECDGPMRLTLTKNSVIKYMEKTNRLRREFDLSPYVDQRIKMMETFFNTTFLEETKKLDEF